MSVTTSGGTGEGASTSTSSYICLPCHYSCKTCRGPNEYDCLSCHNDANLHVMPGDESVFSRNESHCYPAVLLQSVNTNEFWYKTLLVTVIVNVLLVCLLLIYIWFQRRSPVEGPSERRSYRRVSPDDDHSTALDVGGYAYGGYDEDEEDDSDAEEEAFTKLAPSNSQDEQRINFKNNLAAFVKSHNSVLPTSDNAADRRALLNNNSGLGSSARTNSKNVV